MEISKCGKQALRRVAAQILVFVMLLSNIISEPLMTLADGGGMQLSQANVEFLAWHLDIPELTGYWYATDGVNANNSVLEFIYATGARGPGHATRWPANVPNTADGWFMRGGAGFGPGVSGGWLLTLSTAGWQDITFSAQQSSSNQGPSEFGLAYRLSEADSWNSFGDGSWDRVTVADGGADGRTFGDTFVNVPLPEAVSDQDFVQIKIYIATDMRRSGTPSLGHDGGNTSINNIVFAGNPVDSELLAWRVERPDPASNQYRTATDGSNAAASTLEFFYADGTRATLGRNQDDRMPVNVPNNAGRWFPADGEINANTSAGWVITFDATGWEDATFSAQQSSSNNGPSEFGLAFRLSTSDAWTSFGDASWDRVTVNGDTTAGSGIISLGDTFIDVPLPAAINNQPFVQIKAYIASAARRSDGALTLDATGGNTSINNIVFARASTPGVIVVNRAPLAATIADAQGRVESHFTTVSWQNMQAALAAAIAVYGNEYAVQQEVNAARSALVSALNALAPVMPDLSGSDNGNLRFVGDFLIAPAAVADDGGAAEITVFNHVNSMLYVVSGAHGRIERIYLGSLTGEDEAPRWTTATAPGREVFTDADMAAAMGISANDIGGMESLTISYRHEIIAIAVQHSQVAADGWIVLTDFDLNYIASFAAGIQPDFIGTSPDENFIITANEGEPRITGPQNNPANDPPGSVTILDLSAFSGQITSDTDLSLAVADTLTFHSWDNRRDDLVASGVIMTPGVPPSLDLEPEYIAFSYCSTIAWVALQENNAIAVLDIVNREFTNIRGLGFKYHGTPGNEIDHIRGGGANVVLAPGFYSVYQPDGIAAFVDPQTGRQYLVTANEGDFRHWTGATTNYTEPGDAGRRMIASRNDGLGIGADGRPRDGRVFFGARSFSVWDVELFNDTSNTYIPAPTFDSGSDFEKHILRMYGPGAFNLCNENDDRTDRRSNRKGPEPEDVSVLFRGERIFAVIGIERQGGVMVYDITNPHAPFYYDHINMRNIVGGNSGPISSRRSLGPEGVTTVEASQSPTRRPLILVANEVSGNVDFFQMENFVPAESIVVSEQNGNFTAFLENSGGAAMPNELVTVTLSGGAAFEDGSFVQTVRTNSNGIAQIPSITGMEYGVSITANWGVHTDISDTLYVTPAAQYTITEVRVTPEAETVNPGQWRQFNATVYGTNVPPQTVTWSVEGDAATDTTISVFGILTVAPNQEAGTLTIRAASTHAPEVYGTAVVTVTVPPANDGGGGTGGGGGSGTGGGAWSPPVTPTPTPEPTPVPTPTPEPDSSIPAPSWTNPFTDVNESDWFFSSVRFAHQNNLFSGTSATTFSPNMTMTRGMMVTVLHRLAGTPEAGSAVFNDVAHGAWYAEAVNWAAANDIVSGFGDGRFGPGYDITREQMAVKLDRFSAQMGIELPVIRTGAFIDAYQISYWAAQAVSPMFEAGIINGRGNGIFDPRGIATRAEIATVLQNFMQVADMLSTSENSQAELAAVTE